MGIASGAQQRIFEEFVQEDNDARDRRRGLGLGLAIARRFVLLMNGDITVRSAPGRGSTMTVTLPRAPVTVDVLLDRPEQPASEPPMRPVHYVESAPGDLLAHPDDATQPVLAMREVLLVEDDSLVAAATRQLLRSWGLQVRHVETAADAMRDTNFGDIAICDARLPHGASGLDVALALRKRGKKVLLISGETNAALRDAGLNYAQVQQAYVGYVYGDSTAGQRALYEVGMTGIPVVNVNNNCSTGSSALYLARQAVESGAVECALALGFEQ
eukprot:gene6203-7899_t